MQNLPSGVRQVNNEYPSQNTPALLKKIPIDVRRRFYCGSFISSGKDEIKRFYHQAKNLRRHEKICSNPPIRNETTGAESYSNQIGKWTGSCFFRRKTTF